jgi:hypothetical protein
MRATDAARRKWQWNWLVLFIANLPLPLALGIGVLHNGGFLGMLAALPLLWLCGHVAVERMPRLRGPLAVGGTLVALAQCAVVVHLCAGFVALWLVKQLGPESSDRLSEVQAFFATAFTAGQLLFAALLFGGAAAWLSGPAAPPANDNDEDEL